MKLENRTRISVQGLLVLRHRHSPFQQPPPTLPKLHRLTTASLSSHPFILIEAGHLQNTPITLPIPLFNALVTFPLSSGAAAAAAASSPPVLPWCLPSAPYTTAGTEPELVWQRDLVF